MRKETEERLVMLAFATVMVSLILVFVGGITLAALSGHLGWLLLSLVAGILLYTA